MSEHLSPIPQDSRPFSEWGGEHIEQIFPQASLDTIQGHPDTHFSSIGVMPIFYDPAGNIRTVKQKHTEKIPEGGFSPPGETSKYLDGIIEPTEATISRLVFEELDIRRPENLRMYTHKDPLKNHFPLKEFRGSKRNVLVTYPLIGLGPVSTKKLTSSFNENNHEVSDVSFKSIAELIALDEMQQLRIGVSALVQYLHMKPALLHIPRKERLYFRLPPIQQLDNARDIHLGEELAS